MVAYTVHSGGGEQPSMSHLYQVRFINLLKNLSNKNLNFYHRKYEVVFGEAGLVTVMTRVL